MTVRVYKSSDLDAPVLNESSGTLINVLDACLVNGYTGKTAAGWAKAFSESTTRAAYRPPIGNRMYLMVDDAGGITPRSRIIGNATEWNAGEWVAPVDAMQPGGYYLPKHNGVAGARGWYVVATEKFVYFWTQWSNDLDNKYGALWYFGDVTPVRSSDIYATILVGSYVVVDANHWPGTWYTSTIANTVGPRATVSQSPVALPNTYMVYTGKVWARSFTGIGTGEYATTQHDMSRFQQGHIRESSGGIYDAWGSSGTYSCYHWATPTSANPSPVDGSLLFSPVVASEGVSPRGIVPGLWVPLFASGPHYNGTRMVGNGQFAGKEFLFLYTPWGMAAIEVSDTW